MSAPLLPALAAERFRTHFAASPRLFQAPGRINIIGEHTDYSGGLVMPAAINRHCVVAAGVGEPGRLRIVASGPDRTADLDLSALTPTGAWSDYVAGVASVLMAAGVPVRGADLWIESDVPIGAGVSSSAALEVASALAFLALAGVTASGPQVALWAQAAENQFVGVPCGIMDQFASANGVEGCALMLNCANLAFQPVAIPDGARFLLVDSMVRHALVDGGYKARRADCEAAAASLGLSWLGELDAADLPAALARLEGNPAKRCRHVVSEIARVRRAAEAMRAHDLAALGDLMNRSHASLSQDMQVSHPQVDVLAGMAQRTPGVHGARMMGGGFGGCIIALVAEHDAERAMRDITAQYGAIIDREPHAFICRAVAGAGEVVP